LGALRCAGRVGEAVHRVIPYERCSWHTVDPGTIQ
jgi:hypothetical protein